MVTVAVSLGWLMLFEIMDKYNHNYNDSENLDVAAELRSQNIF